MLNPLLKFKEVTKYAVFFEKNGSLLLYKFLKLIINLQRYEDSRNKHTYFSIFDFLREIRKF